MIRRAERIRWLDIGPDRFIPTGPLREVRLAEVLATPKNPLKHTPRALNWVVVVIGLSDKEGTPLPDQLAVEKTFMRLRADQVTDPQATFRYQEGLFGGYRERSVAVEVWPEHGEQVILLVKRISDIVAIILADTNQVSAVMQVWVDGRLSRMEDLTLE